LLDVASSAAIVTVVPVAVVSIPSPPVIVNVSPIVAAAFPESLVSVISFAVIAPEEAVKWVESKEATPLFVALASSAEIVTVLLVIAVSMPSPPVKLSVSLIRDTVSVPLSPAISSSVEIVVNATAPLPSVMMA